MNKDLDVTNDFIFKAIFGKKGNEEILKSLLEAILNLSINQVEIIENTKLAQEFQKQKLGILDIRAKLQDGTKINIEMQVVNKHDILERTLFYWSKLYIEDVKQGDDYKDLAKTININILKYNFLPKDEYCLSSHLYYDKYKEEVLTNKLEIYLIDLIKFKKLVKKVDNRLIAWLSFIEGATKKW